MTTRLVQSPRAFTLLELVIGSAVSLAIAGVAVGMLLTAQSVQRETQLKNAVTRDSMYVIDMVGGDIGYAGVGVPYGSDVDGFAGRLRPIVRIAHPKTFAFIGDLPLPNADENGLVVAAALDGAGTGFAVVSDVSLCAPAASAGAYDCDSTANSLTALGPLAGTDECSASRMGARSCPWGLGKWQRDIDDRLLVTIGSPDGRFAQRSVRYSGTAPEAALVDGMVGVRLDGGPVSASTFSRTRVGATTLATVDRVFYSLERLTGGVCDGTSLNCVLLRRQCWGEIFDPNAAGYPPAGAPALTSAQSPAGCASPGEGTRWETVTTSIDQLTFRYFDAAGTELAAPVPAAQLPNIAAVEVDIMITRPIPVTTRTLTHRMTRRWFLDAGDGLGALGRR